MEGRITEIEVAKVVVEVVGESVKKILAGLVLMPWSLLLLMAASCPPKPPTPTPSPTPVPTPSPSPTPDSSMLLRIGPGPILTNLKGEQVHFRQFIAYSVPGPEINSRWPLISPQAMDFFAAYGAKSFHMRLGPFIAACSDDTNPACGETLWADIGGGYKSDGSFNEAFFQAVEANISYAESKGWWVEVNIIDTWGCKHSQAGNPYSGWSGNALAACGRVAGDPTEEAWVRKWVGLLSYHANIVWLLDNEGDNIQGARQAWWDWEWQVIRDEEAKHGANVHLTGANPTFIGNADYTYTHAVGPISVIAGRWSTNNEHNPDNYQPGQEAANFANGEKAGLSYAYWQDDSTDAQALQALEGIKAWIDGTAPVGCFAPDGEDPLWNPTPIPGGNSNRRSSVQQAEATLGNVCGQDPPTSLERLATQLRLQGLCASKNNDSVFVLDVFPQYQEFHAVAYGGNPPGCWTQDVTVNPKNTWVYTGPDPSPPDQCPGDQPAATAIFCKPQSNIYDCTPWSGGKPVAPEDDPLRACKERKAMGGAPTYTLTTADPISLLTLPNPMQFKINGPASGTGVVTCTVPRAAGNLCRTATSPNGVPVSR